jgi:uncharacterized membrane protein
MRKVGMVGLGTPEEIHWDVPADISADGAFVVGYFEGDAIWYATAGSFAWTRSKGWNALDFGVGEETQTTAMSADGSVLAGDSIGASVTPFRWTKRGGFEILSGLDSDYYNSYVHGISTDGTVVVGQTSNFSDPEAPYLTNEAYRWTKSDGVELLGDLPGGDYDSSARAASADGTVIVGNSDTRRGREAFIWDRFSGMRSLQYLLVNRYGLDLSDWSLIEATGISDDGMVIVGTGTNPDGHTEAWIVDLHKH